MLPVMVTQMDLFNRLLDTTPLKARQFGLPLAAAVLLLIVWEIGKLIARRRTIPGPQSSISGTASAAPGSIADG